MKKKLLYITITGLVLFGALQLYRPVLPNPAVTQDFDGPEIKQ